MRFFCYFDIAFCWSFSDVKVDGFGCGQLRGFGNAGGWLPGADQSSLRFSGFGRNPSGRQRVRGDSRGVVLRGRFKGASAVVRLSGGYFGRSTEQTPFRQ